MLTRVQGCNNSQRYWDDIAEDDDVTRVTMDVPYEKVIHNAAATWDFFPGHHNPEYAKGQGQKTIFISTLFFQGFADRVITDWAGPKSFITRRKIMMRGSVYAGDTMYGEGKVTKKYVDDLGRNLVDVEMVIGNQDGPQCPVSVTVMIPTKNEG